jgi:hypothetical protein
VYREIKPLPRPFGTLRGQPPGRHLPTPPRRRRRRR